MVKVSSSEKKILIAGATGFIGSHLTHEFLKNGFKVIILKRSFDDTARIKDDLTAVKVYDTDKIELASVFNEQKIDIVINLVTNFGRGAANKPSDIVETNIQYSLKLIEAAVNGKAQCFFNVDSALNPEINLYAYTKRAFREIIRKYFAEQIKIMNLRLEQVYGENDDLFKFIPMAVAKLKKNEALDMTVGEQKLDLIYINDCVSALVFLVKNVDKYSDRFNFFEIGTGKTILLKDFIQKIKEKLDSKSRINFGAIEYRAEEQMFSKANLSAMKGWQAKYSFEEGIEQLTK